VRAEQPGRTALVAFFFAAQRGGWMFRSLITRAGTCLGIAASLILTACGGHSTSALPTQNQTAALKHAASFIADSRNRTVKDLGSFASSRKAAVTSTSTEPVTADMPVPRPAESPCIVTLFSGYTFEDYNNHTFAYTPPSSPCAGPWNKVVLDVDLSVSEGVQYDRTGSLWIGGTNVWFGTTAEPSPSNSPAWHVERDVTDLAPIFTSASTGNVFIGNNMCCGLTGVITGSAKLEFYPATAQLPAANTPDAVYSLANPPPGNNTFVGPYESPSLSGTFSFPRNVEKAYLDVYMQGQSSFDNYPLQGFEEFWYSCLPNDIAQTMVNTYGLYQCEGTAFREAEVAIDGTPAGVAPIYPWIFTGGWDPYLWTPIPGLETLNFNPYRVDLTPFAGVLDDGNQHSVSVTVYNDQDYFSGNAALLLYEDHGQSVDTGYLKQNGTSASPSQSVAEGETFGSSAITGNVRVTGVHSVALDGVLNTSQGTIETKVQQSIRFSNSQNLNVAYNGLTWQQDITQETDVDSSTQTITGSGTSVATAQVRYPFTLDYYFKPTANGYAQIMNVSQGKSVNAATQGGSTRSSSTLSNSVNAADTLSWDSNFNFLGPSNGSSSQHYTYRDSSGTCYDKTITSANYTITGTVTGC
jgi:hypothetical protein